MKLIKLSVLRNQSIISTNYSVLRIGFPASLELNYFSNSIRRSLLRDIGTFKITEKLILVSRRNIFSPYESFSNSANLEGIRQSIKEVETNLLSLAFRVKNKRYNGIENGSFFINFGKIGTGKLRASGLKTTIPNEIEAVNKSKLILNIVSNQIKVKIIGFVEFLKANYKNSIVNVNYSCD
uniref:RNA polymerase alpha subunit n=1 Tax=Trachelomonas volvocina TaxID=103340 RepID=A0A0G3VSC7_9EUGL|nr:RNA polymerase alpha subunit [Trachelomonas volvocina]AKL82419.1 RNA polymerase alpha subunit [Trachelomonas volvocina]